MYDRDGRLTREAMEAVIKGGGSVLHHTTQQHDERGNTIFVPMGPIEHIKDLPSAAALARGDAGKVAKAKADLLAAKTRLDAELALLDSDAPGSGEAVVEEGFDAETASYAALKAKAKELNIVGNLPQDVLRERVKTALVEV